jgi:hypothetical protein
MPRIFDNIETQLLGVLVQTLHVSDRADFCVGYFNLRGWKELDDHIQHWSDSSGACRLLVGMQKPPQEQLREALSLLGQSESIDNQSAIRIKKRLAEEFRRQLTFPKEWRDGIDNGRLLMLSAFPKNIRRPTAAFADRRNQLVAALADEIAFFHITPGGKMDKLRVQVEAWGITMTAPRQVP